MEINGTVMQFFHDGQDFPERAGSDEKATAYTVGFNQAATMAAGHPHRGILREIHESVRCVKGPEIRLFSGGLRPDFPGMPERLTGHSRRYIPGPNARSRQSLSVERSNGRSWRYGAHRAGYLRCNRQERTWYFPAPAPVFLLQPNGVSFSPEHCFGPVGRGNQWRWDVGDADFGCPESLEIGWRF